MDSRISQISLRSAALSVADLVLPRVCVVCGRALLLGETHVCTTCAADLPRTFFADFRENPMALAFNALVERELGVDSPSGACSLPALDYQPYSYAAALFFYRGDSPYSLIPQALKYGRNFEAGRHFARMLGLELAASALFSDVDALIPVPLHWIRRWRRGYNQAEVIARGVAEGFAEGMATDSSSTRPAVPVLTGVLRRVRRTRTQTRLDASGRYGNVRSAFVTDGRRLASELAAVVSAPESGTPSLFSPDHPCHLLLLDDVFTTGATLLACERALRAGLAAVFGHKTASCVRISLATLAYVGK